MKLALSTYRLTCIHTTTGEVETHEVQAMDLGEAIDKVEMHGVYAVDDGELVEEEPA